MQPQPYSNIEHPPDSSVRIASLPRSVWLITVLYIAVHLTLSLAFDFTHPESLLTGDRSDLRMFKVQSLLATESAGQFLDRMFSAGLPGDYLWHAAIHAVIRDLPAPHVWMVMAQTASWGVSIILLALICSLLGLDHRVITLAVSIYALLPHSIAFPHMLLSEVFFVPLVMAATYYSLCWMQQPGQRKFRILSALMWGVSALTRPEALLAPAVVATFLLLTRRNRASEILKFLGVFAGVIALWVLPSLLLSGNVNLSNQSPSQFHKLLHRKATFLILTLSAEAKAQEENRIEAVLPEEYTLRDLTGLYLRNPAHAMVISAFEESKLILRFDETKILTYLGVWVADPDWHRDLARQDLSVFLSEQGPILLVVFIGSMLWFVLLLFASYGVYRFWRRAEYLFILLLVFYSLGSVLMTDNTQARLRAGVNYAFVLFASIGYFAWRDRRAGLVVSGTLTSTGRRRWSSLEGK